MTEKDKQGLDESLKTIKDICFRDDASPDLRKLGELFVELGETSIALSRHNDKLVELKDHLVKFLK